MVDLKDLRQNPEDYQDSADQRGINVNVAEVLKLDDRHRELLAKVESLRAELNVKGKPSPEELKKLQATKQELEKLESELADVQAKLDDELMSLPNRLSPGTPQGGEEANRSERTWGEAKKQAGFKDHQTLAETNGWLDFERGAKVAGNKFYYMKGAAVRLELAVMRLAMDALEDAGFTLMSVPHLVNSRVAAGTGFLPRGEEKQVYQIQDEDLNLIATAEIPLTGYHADEILDPAALPLMYAGFSPSYRREAGAYGKHSQGLYRVHQFDKLEMYVYCAPEDSADWLERLVGYEEELCRQLEIPYRVVRIAAGDLGAPAYQKYDVEYWSPVDGQYRELMSCSNVTDYQARRLNIRTRDAEGKSQPAHTLNGTALAFSRVFIALLDNHQTADGKVKLPEALRVYYGASVL